MEKKQKKPILFYTIFFIFISVFVFIAFINFDSYLINYNNFIIDEGLVLEKNINTLKHKSRPPTIAYFILIKDKNDSVYDYKIDSNDSKNIYDKIEVNKTIKFKYVKTMILKKKFIVEIL